MTPARSTSVDVILERHGSSAALRESRLQKLYGGRSLVRFLSTSRERLREVAQKLGVHHLANIDGCPAQSLLKRLPDFNSNVAED